LLQRFLSREFPKRNQQLLAARWRWQYQQSAERLQTPVRVWLGGMDGAVIAHHGLIPVTLQAGGVRVPSGWFVDTIVSAEHRQKGLGPRLLLEGDRVVPLALSLGQTKEMRKIALNLGWKSVADLQRSQLLLNPGNVLRNRLPAGVRQVAGGVLLGFQHWQARRHRIETRADGSRLLEQRNVVRFGSGHDALWEEVAGDLKCAVVRDSSFLNWKWVDQPGQKIVRLEWLEEGRCRGVAVLLLPELTPTYRYQRVFLADLVVPLGCPGLVQEVLRSIIETTRRLGGDSIECLHSDSRLTAQLAACGFQSRPPERVLLVRIPEDCDADLRERLWDPNGWYLTMADSDIDRPSTV